MMAFFHSAANRPVESNELSIVMIYCANNGKHYFKSHVGGGSDSHCFDSDSAITDLTSSRLLHAELSWSQRTLVDRQTRFHAPRILMSSTLLSIITIVGRRECRTGLYIFANYCVDVSSQSTRISVCFVDLWLPIWRFLIWKFAIWFNSHSPDCSRFRLFEMTNNNRWADTCLGC